MASPEVNHVICCDVAKVLGWIGLRRMTKREKSTQPAGDRCKRALKMLGQTPAACYLAFVVFERSFRARSANHTVSIYIHPDSRNSMKNRNRDHMCEKMPLLSRVAFAGVNPIKLPVAWSSWQPTASRHRKYANMRRRRQRMNAAFEP